LCLSQASTCISIGVVCCVFSDLCGYLCNLFYHYYLNICFVKV
jgi:hypothetical protein